MSRYQPRRIRYGVADAPTGGLAGLLNQATPGPWHVWVDDLYVKVEGEPDGPNVCNAGRESWPGAMENARLVALAPEMAAWAIKAAAEIERRNREDGYTDEGEALLARFDQLNQKAMSLDHIEPHGR